MKTCHIYPVSAGGGAYHWKWRCIDGKQKSASTRAFELFYDCVEDVRSHGGQVDRVGHCVSLAAIGPRGFPRLAAEIAQTLW